MPRQSKVTLQVARIAQRNTCRQEQRALRRVNFWPHPDPSGHYLGRGEGARMEKTNRLVKYGVPIDPQTMVTALDANTLELEDGHPGLDDQGYIERRNDLF